MEATCVLPELREGPVVPGLAEVSRGTIECHEIRPNAQEQRRNDDAGLLGREWIAAKRFPELRQPFTRLLLDPVPLIPEIQEQAEASYRRAARRGEGEDLRSSPSPPMPTAPSP